MKCPFLKKGPNYSLVLANFFWCVPHFRIASFWVVVLLKRWGHLGTGLLSEHLHVWGYHTVDVLAGLEAYVASSSLVKLLPKWKLIGHVPFKNLNLYLSKRSRVNSLGCNNAIARSSTYMAIYLYAFPLGLIHISGSPLQALNPSSWRQLVKRLCHLKTDKQSPCKSSAIFIYSIDTRSRWLSTGSCIAVGSSTFLVKTCILAASNFQSVETRFHSNIQRARKKLHLDIYYRYII